MTKRFFPRWFEGFDSFQSENPSFDPFNLTVHNELRARGFSQFASPNPAWQAPNFRITNESVGKALEVKNVATGGQNANIKIGPTVESGNAFSARFQPTEFEMARIDLNGVLTSLSLCYLFSFNSAESFDTSAHGINVFAVESGGLVITEGVNGNSQFFLEDTSSPLSSNFGIIGGFNWNEPRHITLHFTNTVSNGEANMNQARVVNIFESTSGGILFSEGIPSGGLSSRHLFWSGAAGMASVQTHRFENGEALLEAGESYFGCKIDDVCLWEYDPELSSGPVSATPNVRVRALPLQNITTDGTEFGSGSLAEKLRSFDGDGSGVALTGTEEIAAETDDSAIQSEFAFGQVLGLGLTLSQAAPEGSFDFNLEINEGSPGTEISSTETQEDATFRPLRVVYKEKANETDWTLADLPNVEIKISGIGSTPE